MKQGMTKVSVLYPNAEGSKFNMDYYMQTHIPMVVGLLGDALKGASAAKGLAGMPPGTAAPYVMMASMFFDSLEDFQNSFGPNADKIMGDLPNFTDIEPVIQVSEVLA